MESSDVGEWASPTALELLEEMVAVIDECGVVVAVLADEVDLNFDELAMVLDGLRQEAIDAFGAANLLNACAALSESWSSGRSRPRAIFARHAEAVRSGAARVKSPQPMLRFPSGYEPDSRPIAQGGGQRPPCGAVAKSTGRACGNSALSIGRGEFLSHCFGHLELHERARYEELREDMAAAERRNREAAVEQIIADGRAVAAEWLERRRDRSAEAIA